MTFEIAVLLILVFSSFVNAGVQLYIHFEAYPLLPFVGKSEFAAYIAEYERRLAVPLLLPFAVSVISGIVAVVAPPENASRIVLGIALVLNIAVAAVTLMVATPVYEAHKKAGSVTTAEMAHLMQINLARLGLTVASCAVLIYVLGDLLGG